MLFVLVFSSRSRSVQYLWTNLFALSHSVAGHVFSGCVQNWHECDVKFSSRFWALQVLKKQKGMVICTPVISLRANKIWIKAVFFLSGCSRCLGSYSPSSLLLRRTQMELVSSKLFNETGWYCVLPLENSSWFPMWMSLFKWEFGLCGEMSC